MKHAYLIIAHNNWEQLKFLIDLLDDPRNDFYLLVDSKVKDFDSSAFLSQFDRRRIKLVPGIGIYWGDYTQIEAEMILLKAAAGSSEDYAYLHFISGTDMPLKSQDDIHKFFEENNGCEFVDYEIFDDTKEAESRVRFYFFFQKFIGRRRHDLVKVFRDFLVFLQKTFGVNRSKNFENDLGKGANWFSITGAFAKYIVENEDFIKKHFGRTFCADEVFLQTMLKMSPFKDNWYGFKAPGFRYPNMRFTDWGRGKPYTFKKDEFFELTDSPYLFARKFGKDIIDDKVKNAIK